ncbi:MAG: hypothetical protein ABI472_23280 [Ginsengibacter sp.]
MKTKIVLIVSLLFSALFNDSCKKSGGTTDPVTPPTQSVFSYGDSVLYQKNQSNDYVVTPSNSLTGKYISFPGGLVIDGNSGAINVTRSETGLKYMVAFIPKGSIDTAFEFVTLSGINYMDGFYVLTGNDSIAYPVYNAQPGVTIPQLNNGSLFDVGGNCNSQGCTVNTGSAAINLAQTVRNGVFGATPSNNDRHEFDLNYQVNDKSNRAANKLRVKLYYFKTMSDVTPEAYNIINSRLGTIINQSNTVPSPNLIAAAAKPRPPCIFIVGR